MVLIVLDLTVSTLLGCGGLERSDLNSFYFARVWQSSKKLNLPVSILQGCVSLERTDFNSFYIGKVW